MTTAKRMMVMCAVVLLALPLLSPMTVFAQTTELTQDRLNEISDRCSNAQISLQQLRKRDAVSRINRGRAYDQVMLQISAFNSRLAFNNISVPELTAVSAELQTKVSQFRAISDNQYLARLESAIRVNCKERPAEFYNLIVKTREDRDKVAAEIDQIDQLIVKYREEVAKYQASLSPEETEVTQ